MVQNQHDASIHLALRTAQTSNSGLHKVIILKKEVKITVDTSEKKEKGNDRQTKY